ncbi:MAG: SBBP repeat-containing protein [Bacteroidia bacterium]|nr:SBBP repeat-containing protein [Bacteroidia bacterium]
MKNVLITIALLYSLTSRAQTLEQANANLQKNNKQFFIENKGQWPAEVLYLTQMRGLNTWITTKGMWYEFYKMEEITFDANAAHKKTPMPSKFEHKNYKRWGHRVGYTLQGNYTNVTTQGLQKQECYYNYFIGNDTTKHASNVGLYKEALVKGVYEGIDMRYYFDNDILRYDYIIHPNANPNQIRFTFNGSDSTYLNSNNELVFTTCLGEVKQANLYTYQNTTKQAVKSQFTQYQNGWGITLGSYNTSETLIIDPLIYSTYIGGNNNERGYDIIVDALGSAYITGYSCSTNYVTTTGAFQTTNNGGADVFVTKLNAAGTLVIYSTYIGGSGDDYANGIALDGFGNAYITGYTSSTNYVTTIGAIQTTNKGGFDAFVTKLNTTGTTVMYSTYMGGNYDDYANDIAINGLGDTYITGNTASTDYVTTTGAFQTINNGGAHIFVTKLNSAGTTVIYSTYIGGNIYETGYSIAIDVLGNAFITGFTYSTNYVTTTGAFQTTNNGGADVFVTKLNAAGTLVIYSTYIGGSGDDYANGISLDGLSNAYIAGESHSTNYVTTTGVFQTVFQGGYSDAFVTKLNANGTALIYSTYIGGNYYDYSSSIALDALGNAYITGGTSSTNYVTTTGAFQTTNNGSADAFVTKLNATGTTVIYSTYLAGSSFDNGKSIALDGVGNAYITGLTESTNYVTTTGAFQTTNNGVIDAFVSKLEICPIVTTTQLITLCANQSLNVGTHIYTASGTYIDGFNASTGCDSVVITQLTVRPTITSTQALTLCANQTTIVGTHTYNTSGTYKDTLTDINGCDSIVTTQLTIQPTITSTQILTLCANQSTIVGTHTYNTSGTYKDTLTAINGCDSIVTTQLTIRPAITSTQTLILCANQSTTVSTHTYNTNGTYKDTLIAINGCDSIVTTQLTIRQAIASAQALTLCANQSTIVGTHTYNTSGTYKDTLTAINGCDSIVTTQLTILPANTSTNGLTLCANQTTAVGTHTYNTSGTYKDTLTAINGCDSIVTTQLTIRPIITSTQELTLCANQSITIGINNYNRSGTYNDTLKSTINCDSIVTTQLTVYPAIMSTQALTLCANQSITIGINNYNRSGTYNDTLKSTANCDSIVTTQLIIEELNSKKCDTLTITLLEIPQGFSPNGDQVNDMFVIKGLENYPNNTLKVFNRWGNLVYESNPYTNNWNGITNKGIILSSSALNSSTFFYILDLGVTGKVPLKGFIYLNR